MMDAEDETQVERPDEQPSGPARELTLHLLRMLETRADAAGIAMQTEIDSFSKRLKLRVLAGAAFFFAVWAGIVLLAIVLPPHMRVPVLSVVVGLFAIGGVIALLATKRRVALREVGSMAWFVDGLKRDFEVFSRVLETSQAATPQASQERKPPNDLAA